MKIINFRGDLTGISAKIAGIVCTAWHERSIVFVLANISLESPQRLCTYITQNRIYRIKVS